ncbi:unnamed protein product [Sphagnum balticum]
MVLGFLVTEGALDLHVVGQNIMESQGMMFAPDTQEVAAMAYDRAAVKCRGVNAVTNFQLSCYLGDSNKSPSPPAVPNGGDTSSEAASQAPVYD